MALKIDHVADRFVGSKGQRGISGGEKRRVSIACELVTMPSILLLDEPTSGLDAHSAFVVMDTLKQLAVSLKTAVVCTIHQPRCASHAVALSMVDKLTARQVQHLHHV